MNSKRKHKATLRAIASLYLLLALSSAAQTEFRYTVNQGKVTINGSAGYKGFSGFVNIPGTIDGSPVSGIGAYAFYLQDRMTGVTIPNGVTDIGSTAFESCGKLTCVVIPGSLMNIGFGAFSGCYNLTNITIPKNVVSIGDVAFSHCVRLAAITVDPRNSAYSSVDGVLFNNNKTRLITCPGGKEGNYTVPDCVTTIGDYAFQDAIHLASIRIPDSVTTIEWHSFNDCTALTNILIGRDVTTIGDYGNEWISFSECPNLGSIIVDALNPVFSSVEGVLFRDGTTILIKCPEGKTGSFNMPNSVTKIGTRSFSRSVYLDNITIADRVNSIEDYAFENCFGLKGVNFGNHVKGIGDAAFVSCTNLTAIVIPDSVNKIGASAFYSCTSLTNVKIGKGVTSIGRGSFSNCGNLSAINVDPKNLVYSSSDGVLLSKHEATLVKCPEGKVGSYSIPDGITAIADGSFSFSALTNIIVPKSVKKIEGQAFLNSKVTAIFFEGNAPRIVGLPRNADALAFADCSHLTFYYQKGTRGWQSEFAGRPTAIWRQ